jgi:AraC family transcriptional regulator, regulatory protein of adaptative response / DNA-3-methyladenine glycosylase II
MVGQQISVSAATALSGRMVRAFGKPFFGIGKLSHLFPSPEALAEADLTTAGPTTARAETVRLLARAVCLWTIRFDGIGNSEDFLKRLCEIPGIGEWTAQYVAMRALGEPDALPAGDLRLLRTLALTSSQKLEKRSEGWRPWRSYAALHLWHSHTGTVLPAETPGSCRTRPSRFTRTRLTPRARRQATRPGVT